MNEIFLLQSFPQRWKPRVLANSWIPVFTGMTVIILIFAFSSFVRAECEVKTPDQWLYALNDFDLMARQAGNKDKKAQAAEQGLAAAACCLAVDAGNVGCIFYRGVHQGWLLDARVKDIRKGLAAMKADFELAEKLKADFDGGAPARALGNLYLNLPALPILGREFSRDLVKAQAYADKAIAIAATNPENLQLMGELALKGGDKVAAAKYFEKGLEMLYRPKSLSPLQRLIFSELSRLLKKTQ